MTNKPECDRIKSSRERRKEMRIEKTRDESYPIALNDTYKKVVFDRYTVMNDREWKKFIKELNKIRKEVKNAAGQSKED